MTVYRACTDSDLPMLKHIWLSCFEEKEEAAELFFQRNKFTFHAYACETDGALVSALYLIDCFIGKERAHYLCGASTLPSYRGRGIMSALISYALKDSIERGDRYSVLFPADETLYGFYERFGYQPSCAEKSAVIGTDTERKNHVGSFDLEALREHRDEKSLIFDPSFVLFAADYYGCYGAVTAQSANAFAFFRPEGDFAEVYCAFFSDIEELKALLGSQGFKSFRLTAAADSALFEGSVTKPYGMILSLTEKEAPENCYIGITLQ